jgi:hypothetical protein
VVSDNLTGSPDHRITDTEGRHCVRLLTLTSSYEPLTGGAEADLISRAVSGRP